MRIITTSLIAATLLAASAAPAAAREGGFGALTAGYNPASGEYCVRTGWSSATWQTGRRIRAGECRIAAEWRRRGLAFDAVSTPRPPAAPAEHLAAR